MNRNATSIGRRLLPPALLEAAKRGSGWVGARRYPHRPIPHTRAYSAYRDRYIARTLANAEVMERFRRSEPLPAGYGAGLDERCVEYPWCLSRLRESDVRVLDAGSVLNTDYILDQPALARTTKHILTLGPEGVAFWERGISYLYEDLRDIPTRDEFYDCAVCLSTLEHVGMDNQDYTTGAETAENRPEDFRVVMGELHRVLRPGGVLLLSIPYGRYEHRRVMQQFDGPLLQRAIEAFPAPASVETTFFRYREGSWRLASQLDCDDARFGVWGTAEAGRVAASVPAAEAVACVRLER